MKGKSCPNCTLVVGPRTLVCTKCGYKFLKSKKEKEKPSKRGRKPKTQPVIPVPLSSIPMPAAPKRRLKRKKKVGPKRVDWLTLQPGNIIKVRSGPYYKNEAGLNISMGERGKYKVWKLEKDGILAFSRNKDESGLMFIYCGPKYFKKELALYKRPHKIWLIKEKEEE